MKITSFKSALGGLLLLTASSNAQNIYVNGSFENYGGSGNSNIGAGLPGWTIGNGGGVDIVFSTGVPPYYWQAADGQVSISLNYFGAETVSQTAATIPGAPYQLTFFMAAEIYGGPSTRTMNVLWNNAVIASPSFQYTGQGPTTMGWMQFSYTVIGTGSDTVSFTSTTTGPYGPALDNVSLVAVPEPTIASFMAMILVLGYRRKK